MACNLNNKIEYKTETIAEQDGVLVKEGTVTYVQDGDSVRRTIRLPLINTTNKKKILQLSMYLINDKGERYMQQVLDNNSPELITSGIITLEPKERYVMEIPYGIHGMDINSSKQYNKVEINQGWFSVSDYSEYEYYRKKTKGY